MGMWRLTLGAAELAVTSVVHMTYAMYVFSTALARDLSQSLNHKTRPLSLMITGSWGSSAENLGNNNNAVVLPADTGGELSPIVLIHGIFGFGQGRLGGLSYFAGAEKKDQCVLVPDLGSLTSIYDRARELFYYLKGGKVDYGEDHSKCFGHSRFGKVYDGGHYPKWDENHPVHLVGHSAGAQVARVLQQMLADKAFEGYPNTSADWVLSVTSLSGALNGTTRTYLDGMQADNGKWMRPICLLQLCRVGVILYEWLEMGWLKSYYSFGFDHFNLGWRTCGVTGLLDRLAGNSGPFASGDWILPDLTIQGTLQLNASLNTFPNTFYFSYATKKTTNLMGLTLPSSILGIHPLLFIRVLQMTQWRHPPHFPPPYKGYRDEDWHDNDGALNTFSMTHPRIPLEHPSTFVEDDSKCHPLQPGNWYYKIVEADHILFIVNRERAGMQFDLIYDSIFQRCRKHIHTTTTRHKATTITTLSQ
ncbi:hypothetical protein AMTR_s00197p00022270 [Amborella trichopoda]|uniref:Lipase-like C-terminal domain-containing protein n=2 Tax=Amborella trichopoda TaxID=13333 RepID=U5D8B3_AMBTC|nr:hypothetical protein AMTR_s00197p00022270 [Amborella trichopoda]